jgi:hypothetical protein
MGDTPFSSLWVKAREAAQKVPPAPDPSAEGWLTTVQTAKALDLRETTFRKRRDGLVKAGHLVRKKVGHFIYYKATGK